MIVEERIYRIRNGRMGRYLQLVREEGWRSSSPSLVVSSAISRPRSAP